MTERPEKPAQRDQPPDRGPRQESANVRAREAERAVRQALRDGSIGRNTKRGHVIISAIELITTEDGLLCIEVLAPGVTEMGETHFRIFNPPLGVRQPDGSVVEDPVMALAEVLALHGGAQRGRRRRTT